MRGFSRMKSSSEEEQEEKDLKPQGFVWLLKVFSIQSVNSPSTFKVVQFVYFHSDPFFSLNITL